MTIFKTEELPLGTVVLCDGGCEGNNLPVSRMKERNMYGGMAVFSNRHLVPSTVYPDQPELPAAETHRFEYGMVDGIATNQVAELLAMVDALSYIVKLRTRCDKLTSVTVTTDSEYALGHARGEYKVGNKTSRLTKNLRAALDNLIIELDKLGVKLEFAHVDNVWVKGVLGH